MTDDWPSIEAVRYADGTVSFPAHPRGRKGGDPVERIDLRDRQAEIVSWTESVATPPGVRAPNLLAIAEFTLGKDSVRMIGQVATDTIQTGDIVKLEYVDELRDPERAVRATDSQRWNGYRFSPVDD